MFHQYIPCSVSPCKPNVLNVCARNKPTKILSEEQHTRISRTVVASIIESKRTQLHLNASSLLAVFLNLIISHCVRQIIVLELLQIQIVYCRIQTGRRVKRSHICPTFLHQNMLIVLIGYTLTRPNSNPNTPFIPDRRKNGRFYSHHHDISFFH